MNDENEYEKATKWNASRYLETEADTAAYLYTVIEVSFSDIVYAKGIFQLARGMSIARDGFIRRCQLQESII